MERRVSGDLRYARTIARIEIKIRVAKKAVEKACIDGHERKWLGSVCLNPYVNKTGGIEVWALEGTPIRGIVIANHATKEVMAFDMQGKRLKVVVKIKDIERGLKCRE